MNTHRRPVHEMFTQPATKALLTVFLLTAGIGGAAQWERVGGSDRHVNYVDTSSVVRLNIDEVSMWHITDYVKPNPYGKGQYRSIRGLQEYNCKFRTARAVRWTLYADGMGTGETIGVIGEFSMGSGVPTDKRHLNESLWNFACAGHVRQ
jgi:hypothetical protein